MSENKASFKKATKNFEGAADVLASVLELPEARFVLGEIQWEISDYGHSLMAFFEGNQSRSLQLEVSDLLGQYHREHLERSRKCYQKAEDFGPA